MAVVIAVRGRSGSGKTTLIEQATARLHARGLSVGIVKHAHEGFTLDRRGKDSHRFWVCGAQAVLVAGPDELFVRQRRSSTGLSDALRLLPRELDCVFIEGFTQQAVSLDAPPSVQVDVTSNSIQVNGQPVVREQAAAALEGAIERSLSCHPGRQRSTRSRP